MSDEFIFILLFLIWFLLAISEYFKLFNLSNILVVLIVAIILKSPISSHLYDYLSYVSDLSLSLDGSYQSNEPIVRLLSLFPFLSNEDLFIIFISVINIIILSLLRRVQSTSLPISSLTYILSVYGLYNSLNLIASASSFIPLLLFYLYPSSLSIKLLLLFSSFLLQPVSAAVCVFIAVLTLLLHSMYNLCFYPYIPSFNSLSFKPLLIAFITLLSVLLVYSRSDDLIGRISLFFFDSSSLSTEKPLYQYYLSTLIPSVYYVFLGLTSKFYLNKPIVLSPIPTFYSLNSIDFTKAPRLLVISSSLSFFLFSFLFLAYGFNLNYLVRSTSIFILLQLFFLSKIVKPVFFLPLLLLYSFQLAFNLFNLTLYI